MSGGVSARQKWSLGAGFLATSYVSQSLMVLAVPFYQMTLGVDPFLLSVVLIIPFLLASLLNPWVGHMSDQLYSRWGRRRPFIFAASWVCALLYGLVWMVPDDWNTNSQLGYFALISLLLYCAYVFLNVPMSCLSFEISREPQQRLAVMGFVSYFVKLGTLLYQWLFPLAQLAIFSSVFVGIKVVGWVVAVLVIGVLGMLPAIFCREQQTLRLPPQHLRLSDSLALIKNNRILGIMLLICLLQLGGGAFSASMDYYLLVYYVHGGDISQGSIDKGWLSTAYTVLGIVAIPILIKCAAQRDKLKVLQAVMLLTALGGLAKWYLYVPGSGLWLILDALLCTAVWSAMSTLVPAIIADISDQHSLNSGQAKEGRFVALFNLVSNFSSVLAILLAGLSLNLIGFDAAAGASQSSASIYSMRIILAGGTFICAVLAWGLLRYQIDRKHN